MSSDLDWGNCEDCHALVSQGELDFYDGICEICDHERVN